MKYLYILLPFLTLLLSCNTTVSEENINLINGYWEIKEVEIPDEKPREYNVNTVVDFFEIKDGKGFRQKVSPQLDGKYQSNAVKETIQIKDSINKTFIYYQTEYAKWVEELVEIEENKMTVINSNNIKYYYERYQPIEI